MATAHAHSQAAGGPKVEVEYVQTFFAVSCSHGWVPPSCKILSQNNLGKKFGRPKHVADHTYRPVKKFAQGIQT